jgi:hypothetical protein
MWKYNKTLLSLFAMYEILEERFCDQKDRAVIMWQLSWWKVYNNVLVEKL